MRKIPFYSPFLPASLKNVVGEVLRSGWLSQGRKTAEFERAFCAVFSIQYAVSVNSCTSALRLAYALAGVGPGDEVVTTPFTMMATNTAIMEQFATPVFAEVDYETGNIDPNDVERRITDKTKAIACVHFAGYPCDLKELHEIADSHNLMLIEDCAHALGATYHGKPLGRDLGCYSFHVCKHITTIDGGMLTTSRQDVYEAAMRRRWFGMDRDRRVPTDLGYPDFDVTELGYKVHMNELAAAMGLESLKHARDLIEKRRSLARIYREELEGVKGIRAFSYANDREHAYWLFPVHVDEREKFAQTMTRNGVEVSIVFRRNDIYTIFGGKRSDLPNMDKLDEDILCLPLHQDLTPEDVEYVVEVSKRAI